MPRALTSILCALSLALALALPPVAAAVELVMGPKSTVPSWICCATSRSPPRTPE